MQCEERVYQSRTLQVGASGTLPALELLLELGQQLEESVFFTEGWAGWRRGQV